MKADIYDYFFNPRVVFGAGSSSRLAGIIDGIGDNILIITGVSSFKKSPFRDALYKDLGKRNIIYSELEVSGEPTTDFIDEAAEYYRKRNINAVVSIGGGSVIDAGKAVSGMIPQTGNVADYIAGTNPKKHNGVKVPFMAVPTTAGTGSEATKNSVLTKPGPGGWKKSLHHDNLVPDIAIIDPALTLSCPPEISAACGMDALTQLIESFVSSESSFLSDALALKGISMHGGKTLIHACTDKSYDILVRSNLAYAAFLSGTALANAGLGPVHGLAGVIGGSFDIPHGTICAVLLSRVTDYNIEKLFSAGDNQALEKYARAGFILSGQQSIDIKAGCSLLSEYLKETAESLNIPEIGDLGLKKGDIDNMAEKAENKNNPVSLTVDDFKNILLGKGR